MEDKWLDFCKEMYLRTLSEREFHNNKANVPLTVISAGIVFSIGYLFQYIVNINDMSLRGIRGIMVIFFIIYIVLFVYCCNLIYKLIYNHDYYHFPKMVELKEYKKKINDEDFKKYLEKLFTEGYDFNFAENSKKSLISLKLGKFLYLDLIVGMFLFLIIGLIEGGII